MRSAVIVAVIIIVAVAIMVFGSSGFTANLFAPTYDGWTIGDVDTCPEPDYDIVAGESRPAAWDCDATRSRWLAFAEAAFDRRDPGHAQILRASIHWDGSNARYLCDPFEIALFELADGSRRAIGVGHFCMERAAVLTHDYGPRS